MRTKSRFEPDRVYRQLTRDEFKRRMEESFSPVYLTSISIIQGVALAILGQQSFQSDAQGNLLIWENKLTLLYAVMSFVSIVGISYEYNWFVGIHRWSQKFLDTLIPFAIGFWEIGAITSIYQPQRWWFMMSAYGILGAIAFLNTYNNCKLDNFKTPNWYDMFRSSIRTSIFLAILGGVTLFIFGLFYHRLKVSYPWYLVDLPFAAVYFGIFSVLLLKDVKFVTSVHEKFRLEC